MITCLSINLQVKCGKCDTRLLLFLVIGLMSQFLYNEIREIVLPLLSSYPASYGNAFYFAHRPLRLTNWPPMFYLLLCIPFIQLQKKLTKTFHIFTDTLSCRLVIDTLSCHTVIHIYISLYKLNTISYG